MPHTSSFNDPTVIWRLKHLDGRHAHGLLIPSGPKAMALWFMSGTPQKVRDFKTWRSALEFLDDARATLETSGWSWWERPKPAVTRTDAGVK